MHIEDLLSYAEEYQHDVVDYLENGKGDEIKGKINLSEKVIKYNRNYCDEFPETLCHEMYHHFFNEMSDTHIPEFLVEDLGLKMAYYNRKLIEEYLKYKIGDYKNATED